MLALVEGRGPFGAQFEGSHQGTHRDELGTFPIARPAPRLDTVPMFETVTDCAIAGEAADVKL
jgi:hypothetical protein